MLYLSAGLKSDRLLEAQHWQMSRSAEQLGISRNTLYRKLRKHGIKLRSTL